MRIEKSPIFRRKSAPWYQCQPFCLLAAAAMLGFIGLGLVGIRVALRHPAFGPHLWVPLFLVMASGFVFLRMLVRLIRGAADSGPSA